MKKSCRNPVILAQEWQQLYHDMGRPQYIHLAKELNVTRFRLYKILSLNKLSPKAQEMVIALGDPISSSTISVTQLLEIVKLPPCKQVQKIKSILNKRK